jgi:hypothetical protein
VPLDEWNLASSFGAQASATMNFLQEDRAPEQRLNEILWHARTGVRAPMPPPRRSLFVRASSAADDDEQEPTVVAR